MKNAFAFLLAFIMLLSLSACGGRKTPSGVRIPEDDGIVDNIIIDGEEVSAVDFVTESCNKFLQSEKYLEANAKFTEMFGEGIPFAVTRVIDLKAYGLGPNMLDIHYMLIKANCNWADEEGHSSEIVLIADYDTGTVWSSFDCDESLKNDETSKDYWTWVMLNSCFVSSDYENDAIIGDDLETRAEFTAEDLAAVNAGIIQ